MTLFKEYGRAEFDDRISKALVKYGDSWCLTNRVDDDELNLSAYVIGPDLNRPTGAPVFIPLTHFSGMDKLAYPQLGYRFAKSGELGMYLIRSPSATRKGLHMDKVKVILLDHSKSIKKMCDVEWPEYDASSVKASLVVYPVLHDMMDGIAKLRSGELVAFSPDINFAVVPVPNSKGWHILYRQQIVGGVSENGSIKFNVKWASKTFDICMKNFGVPKYAKSE